ncbi:MAG: hypothetical protein R3F61_03760 [Myxococcota bacterium]
MDLLSLSAGCVLSVAEVGIEPIEAGWVEEAYVEVLAEGMCRSVDLVLPPGVVVRSLKARTRLSDGTKHRLDTDRQRVITRDLEGRGAIRLYTPELIPGDRVEVKLVRQHPPVDYVWSPGAGARFASLESSLPIPATEGVNVDGDEVWVANPPDTLSITLPHPTGSVGDDAARPLVPVTGAEATVDLELVVPGEPMRTLYPGGGSSRHTTWTVRLPEGDADRGLVLPLPRDATQIAIEGTHLQRDDSVVLWAEAGRVPDHRVSYVTPDAPVYGRKLTLPGAEVTQTVQLEDGRIRWQDDQTWWIGSIGVRAIVPERSQLIRALDNRFRRAALPEPAMPSALRGRATDWDLFAALRPELAKRAGVADLPLAPLFPRKLVKARKSGALTSVEAALIVWVQATQARVPTSWAVVFPANRGTGWHTSPEGYTEGLVAVSLDGETRWIDPSCTVCAPFELRPELEGADMLSPIGLRTPEPREGRMSVVDADGRRTVDLEGPAALSLRLWLTSLPAPDRPAALSARFGGESAVLVGSEGLATPGEPIRIVLEGTGLPDPLVPPEGAWWGWIGERRWERTATEDDRPLHEHQADLCWTARTESGRRTEILEVRSRTIPETVGAAVEAARHAAPPDPGPQSPTDVTQPASPDGGN